MRTKQEIGRHSRRKGSAFEREIARLFSRWCDGLPCRRTPMSGAYGPEWGLAGDLMFQGDNVPNVIIELKRRESWTWPSLLNNRGAVIRWWRTLVKECKKDPRDPEPVLIFKRNRGEIWIGCRSLHSIGAQFGAVPPVIIRLPHVPLCIFRARDVHNWRY